MQNNTKHTLNAAVFASSLALIAPFTSFASDNPGFYERKQEGWFWYEVEPEEVEPVEPPKVQPKTELQPPTQDTIEQEAVNEAPSPFSAAWFRENMQKYKDAWWDNPTVENAQAFAYMQRFAMDRSELAQEAYELAILGDPYLDEVSRRPYATFASQRVDTKAGNERKTLLGQVAKRVGLFFFYKPNCEMCELQAPIVKMLEQGYGFTVVPISSDGSPFPGNIFPNFRKNNGHSEMLNVVTYPALFLASPNGEFAPIGQGVMSLPDTANRILVTAKREGWISDDEFNKTKALVNPNNNISELISEDAEIKTETDLQNETNFIGPSELMEFIRNRIKESN